MKFKIRCQSIKEFDPQKGAYVKCNETIEVDSAQIGTLVRCRACGNDVEVVNVGMLGAATADSNQSNPEDSGDLLTAKEVTPGSSSAESLQSNNARQNEANDLPADMAKAAAAETAPRVEENAAEANTVNEDHVIDLVTDLEPLDSRDARQPVAPIPTFNSGNVADPTVELKKESFDQPGASMLLQSNFDRAHSCHKCGNLLEEKQATCPNCQAPRQAAYVEKKDRILFSRKGPFGFQLWMDGITKRPSEPQEINIFAGVALTVSVMLMGAGIALFVFAGVAGVFVGSAVAFLGYALFVAFRYWGKTRENPRTRVPILGQITWAIMLYLIRSFRFPKLPPERVLNRNGDESFGDQDLAAMKDLGKYRVIDLDGTSVTDAGLLYLYDHRGIHYLVVRNAKVTADGAHDLQQSIPGTWIWY